MSEWQPIETAPKDGSAFLAHMRDNPDLGPLLLKWHPFKKTWVEAWSHESIADAWGDEPAYWMPLPASPSDIGR